MSLFRFLSYPVFISPGSTRAVDYAMEHFYRIRSNTRPRQLLKRLVRPVIPIFRFRECLSSHPQFERLRPYLSEREIEVVVDARRFFRLIDFNRRQVVNVFKGNDLLTYFRNEIAARDKLSGRDFIPGLISVDRAEKVFTEEYACERPFKSIRLRDLDAGDFIGRLKEMLREVRFSAPIRKVDADEFAAGMGKEILSLPGTGEEVRAYVRQLLQDAAGPPEVDLVFSHGDFRKDQVFFSRDGRLKVIDWECSGYFTRYYDQIEFFVNEKWLYGDPSIGLESFLDVERPRLKAICSLFLLELLHFPIRFQRRFLLSDLLPVVRSIGQRLEKHLLARI